MRQERHAGYEVKALSNLIRRKVWELSGQPECDAFTEMQGMLHEMKLDYAVLPADGIYNIDVEEAQKCAEAIGARHSILVHMKPGKLFDETIAERFRPVGRLLVRPGEEIRL